MIKERFRSLVRNSLRRYDQNGRYHDEIIDEAIDAAIKSVYFSLYKNNPSDLSDYVFKYATELSSLSGHHGVYYCDVPYDCVSLPDKASFVRGVRVTDDAGLSDPVNFYPISSVEADLLESSDTWDVGIPNEYTIPYLVGDGRIYFYGVELDPTIETALQQTGAVELDLLRSWGSYSDSDEVKLPFGSDENIYGIVLNFLGVVPPVTTEDKTNDVWQTKAQ